MTIATWPTPKDTDEILDYFIEWEERLAGDTISSSSWAIESPNVATPLLVIVTNSVLGTRSFIWFSGGSTGSTYYVRNRIITSGGRTMDLTGKLKIRDK
jgi:hypothetical protein